jgi:hypothetical protein
MPADDGGVTSSGSINGKVVDVVNDENTNPANFHSSGVRQPLSPTAMVDIASNRQDGCNLAKFVEDFWLADIACMDD